MLSKAMELKAEFERTRSAAQQVIDAAIAGGRDLTTEESEANAKRFSRLESIKRILDEHGKFATLGAAVIATAAAAYPAAASDAVSAAFDRAEFSRAVSRWASTGEMDQKFATITTATQSGLLLPVQVSQPLVPVAPNTFRQAFAIWGVQPNVTTTTAKINVPILTPSAGGLVAENAGAEVENEPGTTGSIVSQPGTYHSGTSWFSNNVIAAQDFDLVNAYTPAFLQNKELGLEAAIAAAMIADAGLTNVVTTSSPTSFTAADLALLDQALPKRYQQMKVIMLSATAYALACGLEFASGGFVLTTDANGIRRYNGTPVLRCDNFQSLAATHIVGCIISIPGFHLRDAGQTKIIRYTQVPSKPDQSGFDLVAYHAYGYDPAAVALFTAHA